MWPLAKRAPRDNRTGEGGSLGPLARAPALFLGELLPSAEEAQRGRVLESGGGSASPPRKEKMLPEGIDKRRAHQARTIKDNPDFILPGRSYPPGIIVMAQMRRHGTNTALILGYQSQPQTAGWLSFSRYSERMIGAGP